MDGLYPLTTQAWVNRTRTGRRAWVRYQEVRRWDSLLCQGAELQAIIVTRLEQNRLCSSPLVQYSATLSRSESLLTCPMDRQRQRPKVLSHPEVPKEMSRG